MGEISPVVSPLANSESTIWSTRATGAGAFHDRPLYGGVDVARPSISSIASPRRLLLCWFCCDLVDRVGHGLTPLLFQTGQLRR
jgi:hypothetical protein